MRIISNEELRPIVGIGDVLQAYEAVLREYYQGNATARPRIDVIAPTSTPGHFYQWGTMEGLSRHFGIFVTRMKSDVAYFVEKADGSRTQEKFNTRPGLYCGLLWVFSIETGTPLAIIQDGYVQHLRVAATAGLAARECALPGAGVVGMLGSGGMARSHLRAFAAVRPIRMVRVYSPTKANREAFAREMQADLEIPVEPVDSPEAAVRQAQIIACCTSAIEPVLRGPWIPDGAFISIVKGHIELDQRAWQRVDRVVQFTRGGESGGSAGPAGPPRQGRSGVLSGPFPSYVAGSTEDFAAIPEAQEEQPAPVRPPSVSFQDVLEGNVLARSNEREVISMSGSGGGQGLQFAAVAGLVCRLAEQHDLGHRVPTEWFLQTERN